MHVFHTHMQCRVRKRQEVCKYRFSVCKCPSIHTWFLLKIVNALKDIFVDFFDRHLKRDLYISKKKKTFVTLINVCGLFLNDIKQELFVCRKSFISTPLKIFKTVLTPCM